MDKFSLKTNIIITKIYLYSYLVLAAYSIYSILFLSVSCGANQRSFIRVNSESKGGFYLYVGGPYLGE
jgi:hypothetical protein